MKRILTLVPTQERSAHGAAREEAALGAHQPLHLWPLSRNPRPKNMAAAEGSGCSQT